MPEEAEATYNALTTSYPESQAAWEAQAAFLHRNDQIPRALKIWTTMAEGADRSEIVRIARLLFSRQQSQAAFNLLQARLEDFARDPIFLNELYQLAIRLERHTEGIPWARKRLLQSSNTFELETAIKQFVRMAHGANQLPTVVAEVQATDHRALTDSCHLAIRCPSAPIPPGHPRQLQSRPRSQPPRIPSRS